MAAEEETRADEHTLKLEVKAYGTRFSGSHLRPGTVSTRRPWAADSSSDGPRPLRELDHGSASLPITEGRGVGGQVSPWRSEAFAFFSLQGQFFMLVSMLVLWRNGLIYIFLSFYLFIFSSKQWNET